MRRILTVALPGRPPLKPTIGVCHRPGCPSTLVRAQSGPSTALPSAAPGADPMKALILGRNGQLGWALERRLAGHAEVIALGRAELDLGDPEAVAAALDTVRPDVVLNAAAYTAVDRAETERELKDAAGDPRARDRVQRDWSRDKGATHTLEGLVGKIDVGQMTTPSLYV